MAFVTVWLMIPGKRLRCWMELGIWAEAASPLRLVLGSNYTSRSRREACWAGRRNISGPRQFRRPLPSQPQFSLVRPDAAHTDWALPGFVQPLLAVRFRRLPVHRWTDWAVGGWLEDWRFLLFASPRSWIAVVSCAPDARGLAVCAGTDSAVPLSLCHPAAHPRRPHPASAFADLNQRLARGTTILIWVATHLEKWGNLKDVREKSAKMYSCLNGSA